MLGTLPPFIRQTVGALLLFAIHPSSVCAQAIVIDSIGAKRLLATAKTSYSVVRSTEARDALSDSLVSIALRRTGDPTRDRAMASIAIMRLGMAGSDPDVAYKGSASRLMKIAIETDDPNTAKAAVASMWSMIDTTSTVDALQRLALQPTVSFNAINMLRLYYSRSEAGKRAFRTLYANREAIPNQLAREYLVEYVRASGLVGRP